jgi:phage shock protein A
MKLNSRDNHRIERIADKALEDIQEAIEEAEGAIADLKEALAVGDADTIFDLGDHTQRLKDAAQTIEDRQEEAQSAIEDVELAD